MDDDRGSRDGNASRGNADDAETTGDDGGTRSVENETESGDGGPRSGDAGSADPEVGSPGAPDGERTDPAGSTATGNGSGFWGPAPEERSPVGLIRWFLTVDEGAVAYLREMLMSVAFVLAIGLLLFAISGVWPPMVAIESGSMEPHIMTGDLVFVMEEHRFSGPNPTVTAGGVSTGVVATRTVERTGDAYTKFSLPGDVIVYQPDGRDGVTPIIHRARFWVNESENWYDKADPEFVGSASNCDELRHCPAPNAGFITKGDNRRTNRRYDQLTGISAPVKPSWVVGTAEFRIPLLGYVRLGLSTLSTGPGPLGPAGAGSGPGRALAGLAMLGGLAGGSLVGKE